MPDSHTLIIGAGIGGLAAAIELAASGLPVTVLEAQAAGGGKIRSAGTAAGPIDAGPTVLTMPWIFDEILRRSGAPLAERVTLQACEVLAHHRWRDGSRLNLYADAKRSIDSVGIFAGRKAADEYRIFCRAAQRAFDALSDSFMRAPQPGLLGLARKSGLGGLRDAAHIQPFVTLWRSLEKAFSDVRLRQLFARYATYCGSSPFRAPATLMLIAHAEQCGVWTLRGGMSALSSALADAARELGVQFEFNARVTQICTRGARAVGIQLADGRSMASTSIVVNADTNALASGLFGPAVSRAVRPTPVHSRSLSAVTWSGAGHFPDADLQLHNVFFSTNYEAEFKSSLTLGKVPAEPTVYLFAADRDNGAPPDAATERTFILINAPPDGDRHSYDREERQRMSQTVLRQLQACGVDAALAFETFEIDTPAEFNERYPATGGALYGPATHGWYAAFRRPGNRTRVPGLYVAGGGVHPGAGLPMAAWSGVLAARSIISDSYHGRRGQRLAGSGH